jgi:hypothetical protein
MRSFIVKWADDHNTDQHIRSLADVAFTNEQYNIVQGSRFDRQFSVIFHLVER